MAWQKRILDLYLEADSPTCLADHHRITFSKSLVTPMAVTSPPAPAP
jgi:hypothetical protein